MGSLMGVRCKTSNEVIRLQGHVETWTLDDFLRLTKLKKIWTSLEKTWMIFEKHGRFLKYVDAFEDAF